MIVKIVLLFLIAMGVMAMFGRLRMPKIDLTRRKTGRCPGCGRHRIGKGPCPCGNDKR
ncbi:hypothetical protein [Allosediminivita pacifica]|uniref:Uncharacterized protein n=1 Tax=Allosediminivita pacifica TaxID=1267769 RepID=A0A2T6AZL2_9RHOB|nr:hypothetical protein [Allosediminivita pacifica]PTX49246.1 hypothetical protein C8N44_10786 [Allosediminivita pacifica]GGB05590.1 hypothetical protein GCM10011324_14620 [Allosediminivita pacifica]